MSSTYPPSNIWPYAMSGCVLFLFTLAPSPSWSNAGGGTEITRWWSQAWSSAANQPAATASNYGVVEVRQQGVPRPVKPLQATISTAKRLAASSVEQPVREDVASLPVKSGGWRHASNKPARVQATLVGHRSRPRADVWCPPEGWVPALIRPLDADSAAPIGGNTSNVVAATGNTADQPAAPHMVPPSAPVSARVVRNQGSTAGPLPAGPQRLAPFPRTRLQPEPQLPPDDVGPNLGGPNMGDPALSGQSYSTQLPGREPHGQRDGDAAPEPTDEQGETQLAEDATTPRPAAVPLKLVPDADQVAGEEQPTTMPPAAPIAPGAASSWPVSADLHELLDIAVDQPLLSEWATLALQQLRQLESGPTPASPEQRRRVAELSRYWRQRQDLRGWPQPERQLFDRIRHGLQRRTDTWSQLQWVAGVQAQAAQGDRNRLRALAAELNAQLEHQPQQAWAAYLRLPELSQLSLDSAGKIVLEETLQRLNADASTLTVDQQQVLGHPSVRELAALSTMCLAHTATAEQALQLLESYESANTSQHAAPLREHLDRWRAAGEQSIYAAPLQTIDRYYRNANVRVSIAEDLINRLVPAVHQYADRVNDTILGAAVSGQNATSALVGVRLIPDNQGIRMALLAQGNVASRTASRKGPVTLYNRGQSTFSAGKEFLVRPHGIFTSETQTRANAGNQLIGMRTDWDSFPLIGWLVRSIARQQHDEQRPLLRAEMLRRVRRSASKQIDRAVQQRLANVEQRLEQRVLGPLKEMSLDPLAMEMRTTADRAIMRARLAGPIQLASHTPRPQARADSQMSLQIHQTAVNNLLEQLDLGGRRMTLRQLAQFVADKLQLPLQVPEHDHYDTVIEFAAGHPIECQFQRGQITLTLHLVELNAGERVWRDFSVRADYLADVRELELHLTREQGIRLSGRRLPVREQIALRGIFTKVLAKNQRLEIIKKAIQQQPKLQSLIVTQLTIRDGWLALALGDSGRATNPALSRQARRPTLPTTRFRK